MYKGSFINDVTQIWTYSDPPLPPLSHKNGYFTYNLIPSVTNVLIPLPLLAWRHLWMPPTFIVHPLPQIHLTKNKYVIHQNSQTYERFFIMYLCAKVHIRYCVARLQPKSRMWRWQSAPSHIQSCQRVPRGTTLLRVEQLSWHFNVKTSWGNY